MENQLLFLFLINNMEICKSCWLSVIHLLQALLFHNHNFHNCQITGIFFRSKWTIQIHCAD